MNLNTLKNIYIVTTVIGPVGFGYLWYSNNSNKIKEKSYGLIINNDNNEKCMNAILTSKLFHASKIITKDNIRTYDEDIFNISRYCNKVYMGEMIDDSIKHGNGLSISNNKLKVGEHFMDAIIGKSIVRYIAVDTKKMNKVSEADNGENKKDSILLKKSSSYIKEKPSLHDMLFSGELSKKYNDNQIDHR
jgi:hypothetical protein